MNRVFFLRVKSYFVIVSNECIYCFQVGVLNNLQKGTFNSRIGTFSKKLTTAFINIWVSGFGGSSKHPRFTSKAILAKAEVRNIV